jgi:hypothetical protein
VWTLTLRGGARVVVVAAEWYDAFGVVTRGRVRLELRNGELGPVLGRGAGFWLRGTGVRALRNPGATSHAGQHPVRHRGARRGQDDGCDQRGDNRTAPSYRSTALRKPADIGPGSPWQMNAPQ